MNGQQPPYQGPYAPPGQGAPVHAPQQGQPPYGPPPGYQQPQQYGPPPGQPPQQQYQRPTDLPPQQPQYPQGPPQQQQYPGMNAAWDAMDPAMRAALEQEERDLQTKRSDGVDYYKIKQPANRGETAESVVRFVPGWPGKQTPGFWHRVYQHYLWVDFSGKKVRLPIPCMREMSAINYPGRPPMPCAICERREYLERIGDRKNADNLDYRARFLANVIDAENLQRHWVADPATGQMITVSAVATIGPGLFRKLGTIMHARGDIANMQTGRLIKIWTTKVGSEARDVRYDAIDATDGPVPVPQGFENMRILDLSQLDRPRDYQEVVGWLDQQYGPMQAQQRPAQGFQQAPMGQQTQAYQQAPQQYQAPAQQPPPRQQVPAQQPPPQFASQWTGTMCSVCGQPQFTSPGGNTCQNGHGGADPAPQQAQRQPQQAQAYQQAPPAAQQQYQAPPAQQQYQAPPQTQQASQQGPPPQQAQYQAPPQQGAPPPAQGQYQQGAPPQQGQPVGQPPGDPDDQIPF